jgi:putative hydrolase of the HAD superfamily
MTHPKVIFLDAVGTLFGVQGSVGQAYSDLAKRFGVEIASEQVDRAFYRSFAAAPPMIFPDAPKTDIPHLEYLWWQAVAAQTFKRVGILSAFEDFDAFFEAVYHHFTTATPWFVYPDTLTSLERWQRMEIELGVISNFDSRIYRVLEALGLSKAFQSVTISTEVGAAKPDPTIFTTALGKHQCEPGFAWHVGDSYHDDFQGATAAGLKAIWLKRQGAMPFVTVR